MHRALIFLLDKRAAACSPVPLGNKGSLSILVFPAPAALRGCLGQQRGEHRVDHFPRAVQMQPPNQLQFTVLEAGSGSQGVGRLGSLVALGARVLTPLASGTSWESPVSPDWQTHRSSCRAVLSLCVSTLASCYACCCYSQFPLLQRSWLYCTRAQRNDLVVLGHLCKD